MSKIRILTNILYFKDETQEYDVLLNTIIQMYESDYDSILVLLRDLKNNSNVGLKNAKDFLDIFIHLKIVYRKNVMFFNEIYAIRKIKKEHLTPDYLFYLVDNNITYDDSYLRREKLDQIFDGNLK
jgi:hypothetical protein